MTTRRKSAESQSLAGPSAECLTTVGRSKSTAPVRMVRATPTLYSMGHVAEQLGRWATRNSSLTRSQRKAGRALELLGLELLVKRAEGHGTEKADHESIHIPSKRNSSGKRNQAASNSRTWRAR